MEEQPKHNDLNFMSVPTAQLKFVVDSQHKTLPAEQFQLLIAEIRRVFDKTSLILSKYKPGIERAMIIHRLLNEQIAKNPVLPTCSKGCGACCHLEVEITQEEGELLALIVLDGFQIDHERLMIQASRERKSPDWKGMVKKVNQCVFLGEDWSCQVYEYRPSTCRKHVVASNPIECGTPDGKVLPIYIPVAEVIFSAALSQPQNPYSSLSKSLVASLDKLEHQFKNEPETRSPEFPALPEVPELSDFPEQPAPL